MSRDKLNYALRVFEYHSMVALFGLLFCWGRIRAFVRRTHNRHQREEA